MGQVSHILFFIQSMSGGGAERVTANLANHWSERGVRVTIVTLSDTKGDAYRLAPDICRISLNLAGESSGAWAAVSNNLRRIRALRRVLRKERPDVVIGIMSTASCLLALAGHNGAKIILGTERAFPPRMPLGRSWEMIRKHAYVRLDKVIVQTKESKRWVEENTRARQVEVIPNPVSFPLPKSPPILPPEEFLNPGRKTLLSVGRLGPEKAHDRLLRAFAELTRQHRGWDLAIVGAGALNDTQKELAQDLGIGDRVIMPGHAGNAADWYEAADLYVMTSLFEGFPNVLIEAMAHGLPVVSVDCDTGPRDIIQNGQNGILVPQDSHAALVSALGKLMDSPARRKELGQNATAIRNSLSLERIIRQWEKIFLSKSEGDR